MFVTALEAKTIGQISVIGHFRLVRTVEGLQATAGSYPFVRLQAMGSRKRFMSRGMTDEICS